MLDTCFLPVFLSMCHLICHIPGSPLSLERGIIKTGITLPAGDRLNSDGGGSTWRCSSAEIMSEFSLFESNIETNEIGFAQRKHQIIYSLSKWRALVCCRWKGYPFFFRFLSAIESKWKSQTTKKPQSTRSGGVNTYLSSANAIFSKVASSSRSTAIEFAAKFFFLPTQHEWQTHTPIPRIDGKHCEFVRNFGWVRRMTHSHSKIYFFNCVLCERAARESSLNKPRVRECEILALHRQWPMKWRRRTHDPYQLLRTKNFECLGAVFTVHSARYSVLFSESNWTKKEWPMRRMEIHKNKNVPCERINTNNNSHNSPLCARGCVWCVVYGNKINKKERSAEHKTKKRETTWIY